MRHPLHSICPYFAMFPENFVAEQLLAYTRPGDLVFDPFCGRGTTILESLLSDRPAIGGDINLVAACVAGAKAHVPDLGEVLDRINLLERDFQIAQPLREEASEFFQLCFHLATYEELLFLRTSLNWKNDPIDRFIAAVILGILHGESHRTELCLSNRMPRTISTKPEYSVRWWKERKLEPPRRHVFKVLREASAFRYTKCPPRKRGRVVLGDSRYASEAFADCKAAVALIVTSPPYLDTTDYSEDQWLRLWFLGGAQKPATRLNRDDRHTVVNEYWSFLREVWAGSATLLRQEAIIVVRIGGMKLSKGELYDGLQTGLSQAMPDRIVKPLHSGKSSEIAKRQTNSFRPGTKSVRLEHDFTFAIS